MEDNNKNIATTIIDTKYDEVTSRSDQIDNNLTHLMSTANEIIEINKSTKKLIYDNYLLIQELSIQHSNALKKCEKNLYKGLKISYFCTGLTIGIIITLIGILLSI